MRHARVFADEDDTDAPRLEPLVEAVGDLSGEAFLQLQPVRVEVDDAASFDSRKIRPAGMYPTCATPRNGTKWCSHTETNGMSRARTSSSQPSSLGNVVRENGRG